MEKSKDNKKTIWIMAGEASGDIYGAMLAKELKQQQDDIVVRGMGAANMKNAGVDIMVDSTELGVVGCVEIFSNIFTFIKIFKSLLERAIRERPDAVVLIDYPGFNIRFAKCLHKHNIPVIWYISPQVWAWRKSNIPKLAKYCSKMMVIFPFETETYKGTGLEVEFVGHPLVSIVQQRADQAITREPNLVVLLPGSRTAEIQKLLEPMLETVLTVSKRKPELKFVIAAPREKIYKQIADIHERFKADHPELPEITIETGKTAELMQRAGTGIAASGTVTVECAIAGLPLVVIYKLNPITFIGANLIITLFRGFFTMVNIIADKVVYEEYVQQFLQSDVLSAALERILPGGYRRQKVLDDMNEVVNLLSAVDSKSASLKAADICRQVMG